MEIYSIYSDNVTVLIVFFIWEEIKLPLEQKSGLMPDRDNIYLLLTFCWSSRSKRQS